MDDTISINDLPEKTREQMRELKEWTETAMWSQIIIEAIEQHWKAVKRDTFGEQGKSVLMKAFSANGGYGDLNYQEVSAGGSLAPVTPEQEQAWTQAIDHASHGRLTAARIALEGAFDEVVIQEDRS